MRFVFSSLLSLCAGSMLYAQTVPVVTIQQVQQATTANLANCIDSTGYVGDTVIVRGVVVMDAKVGTVNNAQVSGGRNTWIQAGTGAFSGLDVFGSSGFTPTPDDILNLVAGDSVEIKGQILNFQSTSNQQATVGESEIVPINVTVLASNRPVKFTPISLADLNDATQVNKIASGEQWEGVYVEIADVEVVQVDLFPNPAKNRVSFIVKDAAGNKMNVSDRFLAQRMPALGGTFVAPSVGDKFDFIRGILIHSPNGCAGVNGRGYELHPFKAADYVKKVGFTAPIIANIARNIVTPTSTQGVTVSADITDDGTVASAYVKYAVGINSTAYDSVAMTVVSGNKYSGTIPAQADGKFVKYVVTAYDNQNLRAVQPGIPTANPIFYTVRDNGTQIYDVQFTPYADGNSGYQNMEVTVEGVVTASTNDLGYTFIQQENALDWGGIMIRPANASLALGDKVKVTGTVKEDFSFTIIDAVSSTQKTGTGTITPLVMPADSFSTYKFSRNERFEGMLIKIQNAGGKKLYVCNKKADAGTNRGEYRVGPDAFDPARGSRVLAGRVTSSVFSSLNVSFVNDSSWFATDGQMNVPLTVVNQGDSVQSITGIMYFAFSNFKLEPRMNSDVEKFHGVNCQQGTIAATDNDGTGTGSATVTLTGGNAPYAYSWNTGATTKTISGATIDPGVYTVNTTDATGCYLTLSVEVKGFKTSVDAAFVESLDFFPNPAKQMLNIRYAFAENTPATAVLRDMLGRVVATVALEGSNGTTAINTENLASGAYSLSIIAADRTVASAKVMVVK